MATEKTEGPSRPELTADQIVLLYEGQLNRAVVWNLIGGLGAIVTAIVVAFLLKPVWLGLVLGVVLILAGGMLQRLLVLRVRCPACGARVLGRIHSIVQARNIKTCPQCEAALRN